MGNTITKCGVTIDAFAHKFGSGGDTLTVDKSLRRKACCSGSLLIALKEANSPPSDPDIVVPPSRNLACFEPDAELKWLAAAADDSSDASFYYKDIFVLNDERIVTRPYEEFPQQFVELAPETGAITATWETDRFRFGESSVDFGTEIHRLTSQGGLIYFDTAHGVYAYGMDGTQRWFRPLAGGSRGADRFGTGRWWVDSRRLWIQTQTPGRRQDHTLVIDLETGQLLQGQRMKEPQLRTYLDFDTIENAVPICYGSTTVLFDSTGQKLWERKFDSIVEGVATVEDTTVVLAKDALHAFDRDGEPQWSHAVDTNLNLYPRDTRLEIIWERNDEERIAELDLGAGELAGMIQGPEEAVAETGLT